MALKFEIGAKPQSIVKNGYFGSAYSHQADSWYSSIWTNGNDLVTSSSPNNETEIAFMHPVVSLEAFTNLSADSVWRRGAFNLVSLDQIQDPTNGPPTHPGLWIAQSGRLQNQDYTVKIRLRKFQDHGGGTGAVKIQLGAGSAVLSANAVGDFTAVITPNLATTDKIYIIWDSCEAHVEFIEVLPSLTTVLVEVENPFGWDQISEEIRFQGGSLVAGFIQDMGFHGLGYDMIRDHYAVMGDDGEMAIRISRDNTVEFTGTIFLDAVSWDLSRCIVECLAESDKGLGRAHRYRDHLISPWDGYSVSGKYIADIPIINSTTGIEIVSGVTGFGYRAWYVHDVLAYFVAAVSDNEFTIDAPMLGGSAQGYPSTGEFASYAIITGAELRKSQSGLPSPMTFHDLLQSILDVFGLYFKVNVTVLEFYPLSDLYDNSNSSATISNIPSFLQESYASKLGFSQMSFEYVAYNDDTGFDSHGKWSWNISNLSSQPASQAENVGSGTRKLESKVIASPVIVNDKYVQPVDTDIFKEYDDKLFFVQLQGHTTYILRPINEYGAYNFASNSKMNATILPWACLDRHRKGIYRSMQLQDVNGSIWFAAYGSANPLTALRSHIADFDNSIGGTNGITTTWIKDFESPDERFFQHVNSFDYPINCDDLLSILSNPEYHVLISPTDSGYIKGWIHTISRNLKTGIASVELISE